MAKDIIGKKAFFEFSSRGGIETVKNGNKLKSNIITALTTKNGERFFSPQIGSNFRDLLMQPNDIVIESELREEVIRTVESAEPRASVEEVTFEREDLKVVMILRFKIIGFETTEEMKVDFFI